MPRHLILVRHGESEWNQFNRFCGWVDVDLSQKGREEAVKAAELLKDGGYKPEHFFTSILRRSVNSMDIMCKDLGWNPLLIIRSWRLNERHYGGLTGLNKGETASKYGEAQVKIWRRSYDVRPPSLDPSSPYNPVNDPLYADVPKEDLPTCESLKDTVERVLPCWKNQIIPALRTGDCLVVIHGTSVRAITKIITDCPDSEISKTEIPTAIPIVYTLDENLNYVTHNHLGDQQAYLEAVEKIKAQGKAK